MLKLCHRLHNVSSLSQEVQNDGNGPIDLESQIPDHHNAMDDMQRSIDLQKAMHHLDQKELTHYQRTLF